MLAAGPSRRTTRGEPVAVTVRPARARRRARRAAALLVLPALLLPACSAGTDPSGGRSTQQRTSTVGADATRSRAAELQAGLTHLLVERVHLTNAARGTTSEPERVAAATALDGVAVALADLLGATSAGDREPLLASLRAADRRTLQDADAVGTPGAAAARSALERAQDELAATVGRVGLALEAEPVRVRLQQDLAAQLAVGGDDAYVLVRAAGGEAAATARLLTVGIAADRDLGPAATPAATLRAELTGLVTEHVLLAGAVAREGARPRDARPGARHASAVRALRANGRALTAALGEGHPSLALEFGPSWDRHVARLVALAAGRTPVQRRVVLAYPAELGPLLADHVTGLPPRTAVVEMQPMLRALVEAVDAATGGATDADALLRRATATAPVPSALLAAAIAQDRRYV